MRQCNDIIQTRECQLTTSRSGLFLLNYKKVLNMCK